MYLQGSSIRIFTLLIIYNTIMIIGVLVSSLNATPRKILLDTDVDTDDFLAILYLLKQNRSEFDLQVPKYDRPVVPLGKAYVAITISANAWTDAGHAVNQVYDLLYMMGRDDILVGVGGEGGILEDGTILPNVGGYLPLIEQGNSTIGSCRYRQSIPVGLGGRLDIDTNFGFRKSFLPQGSRKYSPLEQPTAQQVMTSAVSKGPVTVMITGTHTNFALFLMKNPHLKENVEHVYIMGGGVRSMNPTGCCPENGTSSCMPRQCGDPGNLFTDYTANPYAEFNIYGDPFAAYQVFHSGIPITLVPLDATNTIPITENFFKAFEGNRKTYEAQYCFLSLKMARDTWFDDQFYSSYFMWDSFTSGVAVSIMRNADHQGENDFAEMEYMNITVVTSNEPYGTSDGSNPFFDDRRVPKFGLEKNGVHSGHVQRGLGDPFCIAANGKGNCKDGYTDEVTGSEGVRVLVATKAKLSEDMNSPLDRQFYKDFLDVLNHPHQSGRFNFTTEFPYYSETFYRPDFRNKLLGKPVVFDMDMSVGDFLALLYLLKAPVEVINLKAILISPTGWANAATIDLVYDLLHMMGRDDIPVGLGDVFAMNQSYPPFPAVGSCKYSKAIPNGNGGFLDSDTLYGIGRMLPRSPRRYKAENSVNFGAPRDTDHPKLRQPLALEVWDSMIQDIDSGTKITILTNGPLTTLANILISRRNTIRLIQDVYIVGGHMSYNGTERGNVFTVPSNEYSEFNMFLDPLAAKTVLESKVNIILVPLSIQRQVSSFPSVLQTLVLKKKTPEARFTQYLLSKLYLLQRVQHSYNHMEIFLGEIVGAVLLTDGSSKLRPTFQYAPVKVLATGNAFEDGQIVIDEQHGKSIQVLEGMDVMAYYDIFAFRLCSEEQWVVSTSKKEYGAGCQFSSRHNPHIQYTTFAHSGKKYLFIIGILSLYETDEMCFNIA